MSAIVNSGGDVYFINADHITISIKDMEPMNDDEERLLLILLKGF